MTDISLWQTALVSLIAAVIGGFITHILSVRQDREEKRRELLSKNLVGIWNDLERTGEVQASDSREVLSPLEGAVSGIQLFCTEHTVQIANKLVFDIKEGKTTNTSELMLSLRAELREVLGLKAINQPFITFRLKDFIREKK